MIWPPETQAEPRRRWRGKMQPSAAFAYVTWGRFRPGLADVVEQDELRLRDEIKDPELARHTESL